MIINLQNIEGLIFRDKKVQKLLFDFNQQFNQYLLATKVPGLRSLGKRSVIDVLNNLREEHIVKLREYFNTEITIDRIDYHIVKNYNSDISELESNLCDFQGFQDLCLYRKDNQIYISFWR